MKKFSIYSFEPQKILWVLIIFLVSIRKSDCCKGHLPPKVVFYQRLASTKVCLPPKVVFNWRLSSSEGHLQPKVFFHRRSSSTDGRLPMNVPFHRRLSSTEDCLPSKAVLHQGLCSIKGSPLFFPALYAFFLRISYWQHY